MKAKEYVEKFKSDVKEHGEDKAISKLFIGLFCESEEIMKMRKCVTDKSCANVVREQQLKWEAVRRRLDDPEMLIEKGFQNLVVKKMPEVAKYL